MTRSVHIMLVAAAALLAATLSATAYAESGDSAEAAATLRANISPANAIMTAQNKAHGRAFGMGMEVSQGKSWYEVQVDVGGKPMVARINPSTGAWLGMSPAQGEDAEGMNVLANAKVGLVQAVQDAERSGHGRALEAGPSAAGESAHYDVDVAQKGGAIVHFSVNPQSGAVSTESSNEAD